MSKSTRRNHSASFKAKLSKRSVDSAAAGPTLKVVWDDELRGSASASIRLAARSIS